MVLPLQLAQYRQVGANWNSKPAVQPPSSTDGRIKKEWQLFSVQKEMHMNSRKEDREILRKNGFAENEVLLLSKLRIDYNEKEVRQALADRRRLEFYQWMFETGKLSDQIAWILQCSSRSFLQTMLFTKNMPW
jgi:hypothetical protein